MAYSVAKSIFKNTAVMMATQMITWVSGFVLVLFLPRYLGSEGYGMLYLAMSIQVIFQWVIDYGGQGYIPKEISRNRQNASDLFAHSVVLRFLLWFASVVVSLALCVLAKYSWHVTLLVLILTISNLWSNLTTLLRYCYLGFEEMKYPSIASVLERSFLMLTAVPALLLGAREDVIVVLMAISTLVSFAISMRFVKTIFPVHFSMRLKTLKRLARDGFPYFLWSLFGIIYYRIDAVMLSVMTPVAVVGWYGAAYKLFDILMFLPAIYSSALLPILSRLSKSELKSMRNTSTKSLEFLLLAGIPITISLVFFSGDIIRILFGQAEYGQAAILLQVFSIGMLLVYVDSILSGTVVAIDKQRPWAFVAFLAIFVNVGSNYFLIPYFQEAIGNGGVGAAIATDLTELFVMLSAVFLLPKELFTKKLSATVGKGMIAGVTMSAVVLGGIRLDVPWIVQDFAGLVTYIVSLMLLKAFEPKEVEYIIRAFSIRNFRRLMAEKEGAGT